MKNALIAICFLCSCSSADDITNGDPDASGQSAHLDAGQISDQSSNNLVTTPDSSVQDMGSTDIGSADMATVDMGNPQDMGGQVWPQYSGDPCNVNGQAGRCLPTTSCDGVPSAGHCPGPSSIQCCVTSCGAGDGAGLCTAQSSCPDAPTTAECVGPATGCCGQQSQGTYYGQVYNTYYYLASESDYSGAANTVLNDVNCNPIATVPAAYSDAACIEGSGRLKDGRVVNYAATCSCGRPCPTGGIVCWKALNPVTQPWGQGAFSNALVPMHSIAVDRNEFALKTVIYLPAFDGVQVPALGGVAAFTHDGCFRADDVGGAIIGNHIDIFTGPKSMWQHFEGIFPTRTNFDTYLGASKCDYLKI
jgi:3D (Asp-Asp-Asp) domain-containing protein